MTPFLPILASIALLTTVVVGVSAQGATDYCPGGMLANGTTVSASGGFYAISACSMNFVTFESTMNSALSVTDSSVAEGGLMRAVFGAYALNFKLTATIFLKDARLVMEGTPRDGTSISIIGNSFDVQTQRGGDIIAMDLRRLFNIPAVAIVINTCTAKISANSDVVGLVAGIALIPSTTAKGDFRFTQCNFYLNNSNVVAYGIYIVANSSQIATLTISGNYFYRPETLTAGAEETHAIWAKFPLSPTSNKTGLRFFYAESNVIDRIRYFLSFEGSAVTHIIQYNTHSNHAAVTNSLKFGTSALNVAFQFNTFSTFFESWNPQSAYANPVISFWIDQISQTDLFSFAHNNFYASRYISIPILFPGSTNFLQNSTLSIIGSYFVTNTISLLLLLPMTSFAISPSSPPRTVDLGALIICSNVWPAAYAPATTTTSGTIQTITAATPMTLPAVVSDVLALLVAAAGRPLHVLLTGTDCPLFLALANTRVPNAAPGPLQHHCFALLLFIIFAGWLLSF